MYDNYKIPDIKRLDNIKPLNSFFYYSCFNCALFPVLIYFDKSILPVLINGIPLYRLGDKCGNISLFTEFDFIRDMKEILDDLGVSVEAKEISKDIVKDIIDSIAEDKPVIISVDCFYSSLRKDLYNKEHLRHSLLIFGYDQTKGTFKIIEQENRDTIIFNEIDISFEDIVNSYKGFFESFFVEGEKTYLSFSAASEPGKEAAAGYSYTDLYRNNLRLLQKNIAGGFESLKSFSESFNRLIEDSDRLQEGSLDMINGFNDIIKAKNAERYLVEELFGTASEEARLLKDITDKWNAVRLKLAKFYYSGVYRAGSLQEAGVLLNEIVPLGKKYFEILIG